MATTAAAAPSPAPLQLDVSTPSLGVRVSLEDGKVCLHIGNDSGRGAPCGMLVLPVTSNDPLTLMPAINLATEYKRDRLNLYRRTAGVQSPPPYTERYDAAEWLGRVRRVGKSRLDPYSGRSQYSLCRDAKPRHRVRLQLRRSDSRQQSESCSLSGVPSGRFRRRP